MTLYPLLFHPIVKPKVWGSETWALSGCGEDLSVVSNGFLAGNTLSDVLEIYMDELVGGHVYDAFGNTFPLLFKFIDAKDNLSIQVHPDDRQAAASGMSGKTEMWYVTAADEAASVVMGFARNTSAEEVRASLQDDTVMGLLQVVPVSKGDVAYIPAGTVHALRRGTQVAEIQQTSDVTYRLYDYRRPGLDGRLRPLHVDEALAVLDFGKRQEPLVRYDRQVSDVPVSLVRDPHFSVSLLRLDRQLERDYAALDSFVVYMCTEGSFSVHCNGADAGGMSEPGVSCGGDMVVRAGQVLLLPAVPTDVTLRPLTTAATVLEISVP